jgi:hypothetical protein
MIKKIVSAKGVAIDIGALREAHGATVAIGNTGTNARGDLLGRGGAIIKDREQVARDYNASNPKAVTVTSVSLKDINDEAMTPAEAWAKVEEKLDRPATKRKIKDAD